MRTRRGGQIADATSFAADKLRRRPVAACRTAFLAAVDFPAFLCRIRDFPAMHGPYSTWPVSGCASTGLPVLTLDRIARCRPAFRLMYPRCMSTMLAGRSLLRRAEASWHPAHAVLSTS